MTARRITILGWRCSGRQRYDEAYDAFYKATWSSAQQEAAYYYLAAIKARECEWAEALELVEKGPGQECA